MLKRLISGTLSAVMCVSAILADHPISRSGVPKSSTDSSSKQQNDDIGMQGVNSFGKFIANAADEDEGPSFGAALSSNDYSITSLEFDPTSGVVSIASTQPDSVKVIVSFIDDETAENAFSLESKIEAGDHINTELKADISRLPEYYIIKAQLFDELNRPVGAPYSIKTYTKSIREVIEAEVSDFEQEYVVNLDEDETNNFLVLSEDTVRAESSENTNIVASADYDNNVFVFDNADETLNSLQEGEYLFVQPDEDNIIAVNVESVEVDGDTVTVKGNDDIDEMFDFIKLYTDGNLSDVELDPSNASEGVSFPDQNEGGELSVNEDGEIDVDYEYTEDMSRYEGIGTDITARAEIGPFDIGKILGTMSGKTPPKGFKANLSIAAEYKLYFYKHHKDFDLGFSMKFLPTFTISIGTTTTPLSTIVGSENLTEKIKENISLFIVNIPTGIPGVIFDIEPSFFIELSGNFNITFKLESLFSINVDNDGIHHDFKPVSSKNVDLKILGTLYTGFELSPKLKLFSKKVAYAEVAIRLGIEITLSIDLADLVERVKSGVTDKEKVSLIDSDEDYVHACAVCGNGKVKFRGEISAKVHVLKYEFTLAKITIRVALRGEDENDPDFHVSTGEPHFGLGKCNYNKYKTVIAVKDQNGYGISGAVVKLGDKTVVTGGNGIAKFYCLNGSHRFEAQYLNASQSGTISVKDTASETPISFTLETNDEGVVKVKDTGRGDTAKGPTVTTVTVTIPKETFTGTVANKEVAEGREEVERGALGKDIGYILYKNGLLSVFGSGEMYNYYSCPIKNKALINTICIENSDDENGEVITSIGNNVFNGCSNVTMIEMPDTITRIGDSAFSNCTSLKRNVYDYENDPDKETFTLPSKIEYIGSSAFYNCSAARLGIIDFPETLTYIGNSAFYNCSDIRSVAVPGAVTEIGDSAFRYCTNMVSAEIKDGVGKLNRAIFANCTSLESLTLPYAGYTLAGVNADNSTQYVSYLFYYSGEGTYSAAYSGIPNTLTKLVITGGKRIPNEALNGFKTLETIEISSSITNIGNSAFANCSNAKFNSDLMRNKFTVIGDSAFYNCASHEFGHIAFPDTLKTIGNSAFYGCSGITSIYVPGNVTSIGDSAFRNCAKMTSAEIKDGVGKLNRAIFANCPSLASLTLPYAGYTLAGVNADNSTQYVSYLFYYSGEGTYSAAYSGIPNKLKTLVITGGTRIPNEALNGFKTLETIKLPESIVSIGNSAFANCSKAVFNESFMSNKFTVIGDSAFYNCASHEFGHIAFPDTLKTIGGSAFYGCSGITSIYVPGNVTSIGDSAFRYCVNMTSAEIADGVGKLNRAILANCPSLESLTLPYAGYTLAGVNADNSTQYVSYLFYYSGEGTYSAAYSGIPNKLKTLVITGGTRIPNEALNGFKTLETIKLPESIVSIGNSAFANCSKTKFNYSLRTNQYETIGDNAFYNCAAAEFDRIIFSSSLKTIGNSAFYGCSGITSIYVPGNVTSIGDSAFRYCVNMTSAEIADGVGKLNKAIFANCTSLETLTLPYAGYTLDGVNKEGSTQYVSYLFYYSGADTYSAAYSGIPNKLKTLVITGGTRIPNEALNGFTSLETITLPESIVSIGNSAFANCSKTKFNYSLRTNQYETIGDNAFYNCAAAEFDRIIFSSSLKTIGNSAFYGCSGITSIYVPGNVTNIGDSAFRYCVNMTSAEIADGVGKLNRAIFANCTSLETLTLPYAGYTLDGVNKEVSTQYVSYLFYYGGADTYSAAYSGIPNKLKTLVITGGTRIPNEALNGFTSLETITLPESIVSIGNSAFANCKNLKFNDSFMNNAFITIGDSAFYNCVSHEFGNIVFPKTLTYIGSSAFYSCSGITGIYVPGSVTNIGDSAFRYCVNMTSAELEDGVGKLNKAIFANCTSLESLTLPYAGYTLDGVNKEGSTQYVSYLFYYSGDGTYSATYSGIPNTLKYITVAGGERIPNEAFSGFKSLETITLPDTITVVGTNAFRGCSSLTDAYINNSAANWVNVVINSGNEPFFSAIKHFRTLEIVKQPTDAVVVSGEYGNFSVAASGDDITYSWEYSFDGETWTETGVDTRSLAAIFEDIHNNISFRCVLTDKYGTEVISDAAKLTVIPAEKTEEAENVAENDASAENNAETAETETTASDEVTAA